MTTYEADLAAYHKAVAALVVPKFSTSHQRSWWMLENAPKKPHKPEPVMHEIYPRIGTSDRQRAYLVRHGIKHVRTDGEYK